MRGLSAPITFGFISVVGLVATLASIALDLLPAAWAVVAIVGCLLLLALSLWAEMAPDSASRFAARLLHAAKRLQLVLPILIAAITLITLILVVVQRGKLVHIDTSIDRQSGEASRCVRAIRIEGMDPNRGGTYRAADDYPQTYTDGGRVGLTPQPWELPETLGKKTVVAFSYSQIPGRERRQNETSGAYVTFYDAPISFSDYDTLSFSVDGDKGSGGQEVDVAVRLVLEDPSLPLAEREFVVRESPSLQNLGYFPSGHWERVTIDLGEFTLSRMSASADRLEADAINKIVFFVDNDIVDRSESGTIRIKDIRFEKHGDPGSCP
jgi:hypothetical protein